MQVKFFTIPSAVKEYSKQELPFICNEVTFNIYFRYYAQCKISLRKSEELKRKIQSTI